MVPSDREIQEGLRARDRSACEALVCRYHGRIYRLLWADTGDAEDAADLTQQTFIAVWRHLDRAAQAQHLEAWLCHVALRLSRSLRRRLRRRASLASRRSAEPDPPEGAGTEAMRRLEQEATLSALHRLPPRYRHPLLLFAVLGLSHQQVAEALGVTEACARWRVSEARRRLRKALALEEEEALDAR
jgi:RNA polymerase sigma factor (sigma-70 family)